MSDLIVAKKLVSVFTGVDQIMLAALRCTVSYSITPNSLAHANQKRPRWFIDEQIFSILSGDYSWKRKKKRRYITGWSTLRLANNFSFTLVVDNISAYVNWLFDVLLLFPKIVTEIPQTNSEKSKIWSSSKVFCPARIVRLPHSLCADSNWSHTNKILKKK